MAKKNQKSGKLAETEVVKGRFDMAQKLEKERLELKKEMEELMKEYAKATGISKYGKRKAKVGKAANDWQPPATLQLD
ncbi:MAG: hypothetical protein J6K85_03405 [Clostridia bacterium]|nr:hypothetical protein [Clostridia bacterium]